MSTLQERIEEVMAAKGWEHADVVRISGQSSSVVSQWRGRTAKPVKSIAKVDAAVKLQQASGYSAMWIATGAGPKMAATQKPTAPTAPNLPESVSIADWREKAFRMASAIPDADRRGDFIEFLLLVDAEMRR